MRVVIDSSAFIAILLGETEAREFTSVITRSAQRCMSAPTCLECVMIATRELGETGVNSVDELIDLLRIEIVPFTAQAAKLAQTAFLRFGKGRGHPAQLNFGDCISYAASKFELMPLLFKGTDFSHTDVECAA